jgi:hypothetical protein
MLASARATMTALLVLLAASAAGACPLPGSYVVTITGELAGSTKFTRLAMYGFEGTCVGGTGSGTVTERFWYWQGDGTGLSSRRLYGKTSRKVGAPLVPDSAPVLDAKKRIAGMKQFHRGKGRVLSLQGSWSLSANALAITWPDGGTESWRVTWSDDPGESLLHKIELTGASYLAGATYLAPGGTRDPEAPSAGWGFGGPGPDFLVGKETPELVGDYSGLIRRHNAWCGAPPSDDTVYPTGLSLSLFSPTTSEALRYAYPDGGYWAYVYFGRPKRNRDFLARRVMLQTSHDWSGDGAIADDVGHTYSGLQVIDASGAVRGFVFEFSCSDVVC